MQGAYSQRWLLSFSTLLIPGRSGCVDKRTGAAAQKSSNFRRGTFDCPDGTPPTAVAVVAGFAFYRCIEAPLLRLGKQIFASRASVAAAVKAMD
jgi:hypothetical protein